MAAWLLLAGAAPAAFAGPHTKPTDTWQPNGIVNVIEGSADGSIAFVGGQFSYVGPTTGHSARTDEFGSAGIWPTFTGGSVTEVVRDTTTGGWFVGGTFTHVNGVARERLVRVKSTGYLDLTWTLSPTLAPTALLVDGGRLYVGFAGDAWFGTENVKSLAAINIANRDVLDDWVTTPPVISGQVHDIVAEGFPSSNLLVGGQALQLQGVPGSGAWELGRIDPGTRTGDASWPAEQPGTAVERIYDIALDAGTVYVGGTFPNGASSFDLATGTKTSWNPQVNGAVMALAPFGTQVIIGGNFTSAGGITGRQYLASVASTGGLAAANTWAPQPDGAIRDLQVSGGWLYAAGMFKNIGGKQRHNVVRIDPNTANVDNGFAPTTDGLGLDTFVIDGTTAVFGGTVSSTGGVYRKGFAAIDVASGAASSWDAFPAPTFSSVNIRAIHEHQGRLYVGGRIDDRARAVAFDLTTTSRTKVFDQQAGLAGDAGFVNAITVTPSLPRVFLGGNFAQALRSYDINGTERPLVAEPGYDISGSVEALDARGTFAYVGGTFAVGALRYDVTQSGGPLQDNGVDTNWNPNPMSVVQDIELSAGGSMIYLAGSDTEGIYAVDATFGASYAGFDATPLPTRVRAIADAGATIFIGGSTLGYAAPLRDRLAELSATGGAVQAWAPVIPDGVLAIEDLDAVGSRLFAAGGTKIAIYEGDITEPHAVVDKLTDTAGSADGVSVNTATNTVYIQPAANATRTFSVRIQAHDQVRSDRDQTYTGVTGIRTVTWPRPVIGSLPFATENDVEIGRPRGLQLRCWDTVTPGAETTVGLGWARQINWPSTTNPPDATTAYPYTLAAQHDGAVTPDNHATDPFGGMLMSCRWRGYLVRLSDRAWNYRLEAKADDSFRLAKTVAPGTPASWDWLQYDNVGSTILTDVDLTSPQPFTAQWYENNGRAEAVLGWDTSSAGNVTPTPIPEGAFVSDVFYDQGYSVTFPSALSSMTLPTQSIDVHDRAGNLASTAFAIQLDADAPSAPTTFTTSGSYASWTNATSIEIDLVEGADGRSGLGIRRVDRRVAPINPATNACDLTGIDDSDWTPVLTLSESDTSTSHLDMPHPVTTGCYQFRYVAADRVGNVTTPSYPLGAVDDTAWIRVDQVAPDGSGAELAYADGATKVALVDISATLPTDAHSGIDANAGVQLHRQYGTLANGNCTWIGTGMLGTTGVQDDTLTSQGCYRYQMQVTDRAGNPVTPMIGSSAIVRYDTTAPAATIDLADGTVFGPGLQTLTGTLTDGGSGPGGVTIAKTGSNPGPLCTATIDAGAGTWECSFDASVVGEDSFDIVATASDAAGNQTTDTAANVQIDLTAPTFLGVSHSPTGGGYWQYWDTTTPTPTLWFSATPPALSFDLTVGISDATSVGVLYPALGGGWLPNVATTDSMTPYNHSYSWTAGGLGTGPHQLVATDAATNETRFDFDVDVDSTPPNVTPRTYPSGYLLPSASVTIGGDPVDDAAGSGIDTARMDLTREEANLTGGSCDTFTQAASIANAATGSDTLPATTAACYQYRLTVFDEVNNMSDPVGGVIMVDTVTPALGASVSPAAYSNGAALTFSGTLTDANSGPDHVEVAIASGAPAGTACTDTTIVANAWSCTWTPTAAELDGPYSFSVVGYDAASTPSDPATLNVTLDRTGPTLAPQFSELAGSTTYVHVDNTAARPVVWVNGDQSGSFVLDTGAFDAESGVTIGWPAPGTNWTSAPHTATPATNDALYTWTSAVAATPLPNTFQVTASNGAGTNAVPAPVDFQVDRDDPQSGSITYPDGIAATALLTIDDGDDASSGLQTVTVQRQQSATNPATGACANSWGAGFSDLVTLAPGTTTYTDNGVQRGMCYQYQLVVVDNVGHAATYTSPNTFITDTVGVVITPGATTATEGGAAATYDVQLRAQPTGQVRVDFTHSSQVALSQSSVTFDGVTWDDPVTVSVTAANDQVDEASPASETISYATTSLGGDADYVNLTGTHAVSVVDDDIAGVELAPAAGVAVTEGGVGATYTVRLTSQPSSGTVSVTPTVPGDLVLGAPAGTLTFDSNTWDDPVSISVAANDDPDIEGAELATLSYVTSSGTGEYAGTLSDALSVAITDNDVASLEVVSDGTTLAESNLATTERIRVRLTARPALNVNVPISVLGGQVTAVAAVGGANSLTFTNGTWNTWQDVKVTAIQDTVAELTPHSTSVQLSANSSDSKFASMTSRVVSVAINDDDAPGLLSTPGTGWTLDSQGRLLLNETGEGRATVNITVMGDPTSDVVITPSSNVAGQVVFSPTSVTIPGGSHAYSFTITVHAIDDQTAEPSPHEVRLSSTVTTSDPAWALNSISSGYTTALITDGAELDLREEEETREQEPTPPPPTPPTNDGGQDQQTTNDDGGEQQQDTTIVEPAPPAPPADQTPTDEQPTEQPDDDAGEQTIPAGPTLGSEDENKRPARKDEPGNIVTRPVRKLASWAKDNPVAASVGASAAGTAAMWAAGAKPAALAGKMLSGGLGNIPTGPDGLDQARKLLKRRKQQSASERLFRFWRRKKRGGGLDESDIDDDWDDFFGNRAA